MNRKEIAKRYFDAFNAGDAEALISCLDPDVELVGRKRRFRGIEEVWSMVPTEPPHFDHLEGRIVDRKLEQDGDIVTSRATRVMRWRESGEIASEDPVSARLTFRGDKIVKIEPLWTPEP